MAKKRSVSISRAWQYVGLAVVGAVVLGLTVAALQPRTAPVSASDRPALTAEDFATERPTLPKVAFLGDSWAGGAGTDAGGTAASYAGKTAALLGWPYEVFPGGGTGYLGGVEPFAGRVDRLIASDPDIVVVQGSSNDYQFSGPEIEAAADDVYARIRAGLPDAKIVVVGVINSPDSPPDLMDVSRAAVSAAAARAGALWVDGNAEGWLTIPDDFADGYHPNEGGHQKVADRLAPILKQVAAS